jgi:hypothetical protein
VDGLHVTSQQVFLITTAISAVGNFVYALCPHQTVATIVIARGVIGLGSGVLGVSRAVVVVRTQPGPERSRALTLLSASKFGGYALVPVLATFLSSDIWIGSVHISGLTAPGFVLGIANLLLMVAIVCWLSMESPQPVAVHTEPDPAATPDPTQFLGVLVFLLINVTSKGTLTLMETLMTPMIQSFDPNASTSDLLHRTSVFFLCIGLPGLGVLAFVSASKGLSLLHVASFATTLGTIILAHPTTRHLTLASLYIGGGLAWSVGATIAGTLNCAYSANVSVNVWRIM